MPTNRQTTDPTLQLLVALASPRWRDAVGGWLQPPVGGSRKQGPAACAEQGNRAIDGAALHDAARTAGIVGLIAGRLQQLADEPIELERETLRAMVGEALATEVLNRRALEVLVKLHGSARAAGMPLVPIKGSALLLAGLYDDLGARRLVDVDLLVQRAQFSRAERILEQHGYVAEHTRPHALRHEHHVLFRRPDEPKAPIIELHWTPFYTLFEQAAAERDVFDRLVTRSYGTVELDLLDTEDTLLVLLSHLAHHRFRGELKWAVDIAHLALRCGDGLDWETFWARARSLGAERALAFGLLLVDELFGGLGLERYLPSHPRFLLLRRLAPRGALLRKTPQLSIAHRTALDASLLDSWSDRARYLVYKVPEMLERERGLRFPRWLVRGGPSTK